MERKKGDSITSKTSWSRVETRSYSERSMEQQRGLANITAQLYNVMQPLLATA